LLEWENDAVYPTWITWNEIQAINWDEESIQPDQRVHQYEQNAQGDWILRRKSALPVGAANLNVENSWEQNGILYKVKKIRRRDSLSSDWELVFKVMEFLANDFTHSDVRLIIWFDK
jgi:hypothetical protein